MKKVLLIIVSIFIFTGVVFAEALPQPGDRLLLDKEKSPIHYKYINSYANTLKTAFEKSGYRRNHMGTSYDYVIKRDGTICNLKRDLYDNEKISKVVKKIILDNPPPPFYKGMDKEEFNIHVFIGNESSEEFHFEYYSVDNIFWIKIILKR